MKTQILSLLILIVFSLSPLLAHAEETAAEERVVHYAAEKPETKEHALTLLKDKTAEIGKIIKSEPLNDSDLEHIHEISYTLEAAIDKIRETDMNPQTDKIDEAVQALHYASESHDTEKTREWFAKLKSAQEVEHEAHVKKNVYEIVIKDHKFSPETLTVPAGQKIKLKVDNQDPTPEEFESHDFNREKIIGGNKSATIFVGPLKPGKYHYFGEFNMDTANGYIIAE